MKIFLVYLFICIGCFIWLIRDIKEFDHIIKRKDLVTSFFLSFIWPIVVFIELNEWVEAKNVSYKWNQWWDKAVWEKKK